MTVLNIYCKAEISAGQTPETIAKLTKTCNAETTDIYIETVKLSANSCKAQNHTIRSEPVSDHISTKLKNVVRHHDGNVCKNRAQFSLQSV